MTILADGLLSIFYSTANDYCLRKYDAHFIFSAKSVRKKVNFP